MTILLAIAITAIVAAAIGYVAAAILAAGGRDELETQNILLKTHIVSMRLCLRNAHKELRLLHQAFGEGKWQILDDIENAVTATLDDNIF